MDWMNWFAKKLSGKSPQQRRDILAKDLADLMVSLEQLDKKITEQVAQDHLGNATAEKDVDNLMREDDLMKERARLQWRIEFLKKAVQAADNDVVAEQREAEMLKLKEHKRRLEQREARVKETAKIIDLKALDLGEAFRQHFAACEDFDEEKGTSEATRLLSFNAVAERINHALGRVFGITRKAKTRDRHIPLYFLNPETTSVDLRCTRSLFEEMESVCAEVLKDRPRHDRAA
jgi:hypothetical protein